jgi:hypothetical protein
MPLNIEKFSYVVEPAKALKIGAVCLAIAGVSYPVQEIHKINQPKYNQPVLKLAKFVVANELTTKSKAGLLNKISTSRPQSATLPQQIAKQDVTKEQFKLWSRVNACEEGQFGHWAKHLIGSVYSGDIGISNSTWTAYNGDFFASNAGLATPKEQILIGESIEYHYPQPIHLTEQEWLKYGGLRFSTTQKNATYYQKLSVAETANPIVPDQNGICQGW